METIDGLIAVFLCREDPTFEYVADWDFDEALQLAIKTVRDELGETGWHIRDLKEAVRKIQAS